MSIKREGLKVGALAVPIYKMHKIGTSHKFLTYNVGTKQPTTLKAAYTSGLTTMFEVFLSFGSLYQLDCIPAQFFQ